MKTKDWDAEKIKRSEKMKPEKSGRWSKLVEVVIKMKPEKIKIEFTKDEIWCRLGFHNWKLSHTDLLGIRSYWICLRCGKKEGRMEL